MTYSALWFETFMATIAPDRTARELAFLQRQLPLAAFPRVLDVACGAGRHAHALGEAGYAVTAIDASPFALREALRRHTPRVVFMELDMRELAHVPAEFDAAICLWQSFGAFDAATNRRVLFAIHERLRPGGRFILDIYNRRHFESRPVTRRLEAAGRIVDERIVVRDRRLNVVLEYADDRGTDTFDWEIFTPEEIAAAAAGAGFTLVHACSRYDESRPPASEAPGMQLVFERGVPRNGRR